MFAHENMKKLPSKVSNFSIIEETFLYSPDCPNGPKSEIPVLKCGL
jgi:hypothetical protein